MGTRQQRGIQTRQVASAEPMATHEWQQAEEMLAKLVARAFASDHPELFAAMNRDSHGERNE